MAYGSGMKKLSPLTDGQILDALRDSLPEVRRLLDAGCGRGERLAAIHAAMPDCALTGIDLDGENAALAEKTCPSAEIRRGDFCVVSGDLRELDAALCECVLSLTEDPAAALGALNRTLRCGGVLILGDLCVPGGAEPLPLGCGTVRRLFSEAWVEREAARAGFSVAAYADCRQALLTMAAQMIFDGSFCTCVDAGAAEALRAHRAGYGLWILKKEREA